MIKHIIINVINKKTDIREMIKLMLQLHLKKEHEYKVHSGFWVSVFLIYLLCVNWMYSMAVLAIAFKRSMYLTTEAQANIFPSKITSSLAGMD